MSETDRSFIGDLIEQFAYGLGMKIKLGVEIRIAHPLCGRLFYQAGSFKQAHLRLSAQAANVSARDKACSAVRDTACW